MLTTHQKNWKVDQWVAYLKVRDIPIMPRSRFLILAIAEGGDEPTGPHPSQQEPSRLHLVVTRQHRVA